MKGQNARELGSPDFRHPLRTDGDFDEHIDDFSLVTILLSLKAISVNPALLEEYGATDRLIFSEMDYRSLSECEKIAKLLALNNLDINRLLGLLLLAYTEGNLSNVSFKLLNVTKPQRKIIRSLKNHEEDGAVIQDDTVSILHRIMNERDAKFHYCRGIDMPQNYTEALECLNHAEDLGGMEMKEKCIQLRTSILAQMADGNH